MFFVLLSSNPASFSHVSLLFSLLSLFLSLSLSPRRTHTNIHTQEQKCTHARANTHTKKNIYLTDTLNGGTVWTGQSGAPSSGARWQGVASSADGTKLIAADQSIGSANLWFSSDSGATFVAQAAGFPVPTSW